MTIFLSDSFSGADGVTLEAYNPAWAKVVTNTGSIITQGGRARHNSSTTTSIYYRSDALAPSPDYSVSADFVIGGTGASPHAGISGRNSATTANMYLLRIQSGSIILSRIRSGALTTLGTLAFNQVAGVTVRLRLAMKGSEISAYMDEGATPIISVIDSTITEAGYPGLRMATVTSQIQIDNLEASTFDDPGAGSTTTVSPAAAALVVAGYAPSIAQTTNQAVSPAPAGLIVAGYAPTVAQSSGNSISPTPAALVVQGFAPTISQTQRLAVSPAPGGLVVQGWAPTITQTGKQPDPEVGPAHGGGGGAGSVREVRAFADELDRARKPTRAEKKRRRQAIETAVLELLPDEPAAAQAAPVIAQMVARTLPPATWAPVHGPRPVVLPPTVIDDVQARVAEWLADQAHHALLAELEDDFEVELLLLG